MRAVLALSFMLTLTGAANAGTFDYVFVSDAEGCSWLAAKGAQALFEHDLVALSLADGIQANEHYCDFLDVKSGKYGNAMVVTAYCENPGEAFPDLISLSEFDENSINVTSLHQMQEDAAFGAEGMWGTQTYIRCPDLKELPQ